MNLTKERLRVGYNPLINKVADRFREGSTRPIDPAVEEVLPVRADDPLDPEGPDADLIVRWAPGVDAIVNPDVGTIGPYPFRRTGGHTPHGFAWLSGPGIQPGEHGERLSQDVPPTILTLLGHPVPHGIYGRPLSPV